MLHDFRNQLLGWHGSPAGDARLCAALPARVWQIADPQIAMALATNSLAQSAADVVACAAAARSPVTITMRATPAGRPLDLSFKSGAAENRVTVEKN